MRKLYSDTPPASWPEHHVHRAPGEVCPITKEEMAEVDRLTALGRDRGLRKRVTVLDPNTLRYIEMWVPFAESARMMLDHAEKDAYGFSIIEVRSPLRHFRRGWRRHRGWKQPKSPANEG